MKYVHHNINFPFCECQQTDNGGIYFFLTNQNYKLRIRRRKIKYTVQIIVMLIQIIWRNWNDWKGRGANAAEFTQMQTVKFPFCCKVSTQVFETKCVQCNLHKKRAYTQLSLRRTPLGPASAVRLTEVSGL